MKRNIQVKLEEEAIIKSFKVMKTDKHYLKQAKQIEDGFGSDLLEEGEEWWSGNRS